MAHTDTDATKYLIHIIGVGYAAPDGDLTDRDGAARYTREEIDAAHAEVIAICEAADPGGDTSDIIVEVDGG